LVLEHFYLSYMKRPERERVKDEIRPDRSNY